MPIRTSVTCILFLVFLSGCDSSFVYKKKISGKYHLFAVDAMDQLALGEEQPGGDFMGVIPSRVIAMTVSLVALFFYLPASVILLRKNLESNLPEQIALLVLISAFTAFLAWMALHVPLQTDPRALPSQVIKPPAYMPARETYGADGREE